MKNPLIAMLLLLPTLSNAVVATHTPIATYVDITVSYSAAGTVFAVPSAEATALPLVSVVGEFYGPVYNDTLYNSPVYGRADYEVMKATNDVATNNQPVARGQAGTSVKAVRSGTYKWRIPVVIATFTPTHTPVPPTNTPTPNATQTAAPTGTPTSISLGNGVSVSWDSKVSGLVDSSANSTSAVSRGYVDSIGNTTTAAEAIAVATEVQKLKAWALLATPSYN